MNLRIDRDLPVPFGVQLRGLIEYGIACGGARLRSRLPSVRELAACSLRRRTALARSTKN